MRKGNPDSDSRFWTKILIFLKLILRMSPFKVLALNFLLKLLRKTEDIDETKKTRSAFHAICGKLRFNFHDVIKI